MQTDLVGVHGLSAYMPWETSARRDLPVVVGDVFAAFLAAPTLRIVWVRFDRHACLTAARLCPTMRCH